MTPIGLPRMGRLISLLLVSVLLPGCLLCTEGVFLIASNSPLLESIEIHANVLTVLSFTTFTAGIYLLGLASRSAGFWAASLRRKFGMPFPTLDEVYENALYYISEDCIRRSLEGTGVVGAAGELLPGYIHYCKLWLRRFAPEAGVDQHEIEINARFALMVPAALAPFVIFRYMLGESLWRESGVVVLVGISAATVMLGFFVALWILGAGVKQQDVEQKDALNYYVIFWSVIENGPTGNGGEGGSGILGP